MKRWKVLLVSGLVVTIVLFAIGCSRATPTATPVPTPTAIPTATPTSIPTPTPTPYDIGGPSKVQLGEKFSISLAEHVEVSLDPGSAALWFKGVQADSRCPTDVVCVRAGDARIAMVGIESDGQSYELDLVVESGREVTAQFDDLVVRVAELLPYPESATPIPPEEYSVTVTVERVVSTPMKVAASTKSRLPSPESATSDLRAVVEGNNQFGFDLYHGLKGDNGNLFYSPYSISLALAMTYAGAQGETERQMADTLHFDLSQDRLHSVFNGLDLALASRGEGAEGKDGAGFRLNIVNESWGQEGYEFLDTFLDVLAENYGAGMRLLDFQNKSEESRITINEWVSEQTEGRIEDLIPQGVIDALTRLVLTNAIYFNAAWLSPFNEEMTVDGTFHPLDGSETVVPMMKQTESMGYVDGDGYQAIELLYDEGELSMVIILPEKGQYGMVEPLLDRDFLDTVIADMSRRNVTLTMPKFEFESEFSLADMLAAMGMPIAFSVEADFSGMTGHRDLTISDVLHKSFVSVDEAGTEAAAATAVVMKLTAAPEEPLPVTIDRPFIFLIRDIETDVVLFAGRVVDPRA